MLRAGSDHRRRHTHRFRLIDRAICPDDSAVPAIATEEYGRRLVMAQTAELLGPDVADANCAISGSRLELRVVSLGRRNRTRHAYLMLTTEHYPRFSARSGAKTRY